MQIFYNLFIYLYTFSLKLVAPFHPKARSWVRGRKNGFIHIEETFAKTPPQKPLVWVHCASLGEFEQGRPIIELLKARSNTCSIMLTFFSPSGFEIRKNYSLADYVFYLPADTPGNARKFIDLTQPDLAIFVKYEFWYNYLNCLFEKQIPTMLISALFREDQIFFRWYGGLFRKLLPQFRQIFVQNASSFQLLEKFGLNNAKISGDTRIDRVLKIASEAKTFPLIEAFAKGSKVFIIGSSWNRDEQILVDFIQEENPKNWKFIFAPHQIKTANLEALERKIQFPTLRYSEATTTKAGAAKVLLIDNIGMLSSIYKYGNIAYIGGGFGAGIHNTLEPIAFGLPVIFGPKYQKFEEARFLIENGGGFVIRDEQDLIQIFRQLQKKENYAQASFTAKSYVEENKGGSRKIIEQILPLLSGE